MPVAVYRRARWASTCEHAGMDHRSREELLAGLDHVRSAPSDAGTVELIVCRPGLGERDVVDTAELSLDDGVVGDNWRVRPSRGTPDGSANIECQVTLMNARPAALFAGPQSRWPLAGDQL